MKILSWSLGDNTVIQFKITSEPQLPLTVANYRFDLSYNKEIGSADNGSCVVEFYDVDKKDWSPLAGSLSDLAVYNAILQAEEFDGLKYVYFSILDQNDINQQVRDIIDVTPKQGD